MKLGLLLALSVGGTVADKAQQQQQQQQVAGLVVTGREGRETAVHRKWIAGTNARPSGPDPISRQTGAADVKDPSEGTQENSKKIIRAP